MASGKTLAWTTHKEANMDSTADLLAEEQAFYDENADDLLLRYPNRHLLIHGSRVIDTFESMDEAVKSGVRQFGREPFLVRRAGDKQTTFSVPALSLGMLCRS